MLSRTVKPTSLKTRIQKLAKSTKKGLFSTIFMLFFAILGSKSSFSQNEISVAFTTGYLGTQGTSTNKANNILTFSTLGISRAAFVQTDVNGDGLFGDGGTQGNDLAGTIRIYLSSGSVISLTGALNWRETTGSKVEVLGFIFDPGQNATINYSGGTYNIVGGTTANTSTTLGLRSYFSSFSFVDNENRAGNAATSGLLDALNNELLNTPQPTFSLSPNSITEGQNLVYNVSLGPVPNQSYPFVFSLTGTATNGTDYNSTLIFSNGVINNGDGTITVPSGVSSFTVTVATIDDALVESTETVTLTIGAKTATGNVLDNDAALSAGSIGANQTICSGTAPVALTSDAAATAGAAYQWQSSNDNITFNDIPTATSAGYTPGTLTATTYFRRKATLLTNTDYTNVITITVNPIPSAPASITGNLIVTEGSSQSYTAADVTGATYNWTVPGGWTGTSTSNTITLTTGATGGTLSVTATVGGCTSGSRSITLSILTGGTVGANQTICAGTIPAAFNSIDLANPAAGSNYQWQSSTDNINYTDIAGASNINYTPTAALNTTTYYKRKVTNGTTVAYSNTITVTVNPLPAAPTTINGALVVVANNAQTYTASSATATSYTWTAPAGWTGTSTTGSITLTPNSTGGNLSVVANDANGCTSTATSIAISVLSGGTIGADQTICAGTTPAALTSTADAVPSAGSTYQWQSSTDNLTFNDIATATASTYTPTTALNATTYFRRKVTNGTAITYSNVITVTVTPLPSAPASISGDLSVVAGSSFTYTAATVAGATAYTWTIPNGWTGTSTTNTITLTAGSAGGAITVTATANGCVSPATSITVSMLDGGTIAGDQTICSGTIPVAFTSTATANPTVGSTYQWQSSTDNSVFTDIPTATGLTYTPTAALNTTTYYRRKVTNGTAVTYSNTITVTVNPTPAAPASISGSLNVPAGATVTYTAAASAGATSYTWSIPPTWTGTSTTNTITLTAGSTGGTISVIANAVGCSSTPTAITVGMLAGGTVAGNQTICSGTIPTAFTSSLDPSPAAGSTYQWQSSSDNVTFTDIIGASALGYTPTTALTTTAYYRRKVINGAEETFSNTIIVTVNPIPSAPASITGELIVAANTTQTYSAAAVTGATAYTWTIPNGWVGTSTTNTISLTAGTTGGTISVTATVLGCVSPATSISTVILGGGTVAGNQAICSGNIPTAFTSSADAAPLAGTTYQWQSSGDNISFNDITLATGGGYTPTAALSATTYYRRKATNGTAITYSNVITVTVNPTPAAPANITGDLTVIAGSTQIYTAAAVAGATSYTWTTPNGWTGTSTTNAITLVATATGGNLSVVANTATCTGAATTIAIVIVPDSDGDGIADMDDLDDDNDGILDTIENTACTPSSALCDTDGDGTPNLLDLDSDGDGISDVDESNGTDVNNDGRADGAVDANGVPLSANGGSNPPDTDADTRRDPYDVDSDGDGIPDSVEKGPDGNNPLDTDGDGTPDYRDLDSDGDGIPDAIERGIGPTPLDTDGDGIPDYRETDSDNDGIPDAIERGTGPTPKDTDGDGIPDYRDLDSDGDGVPDATERGTGPTPLDSDNDGIPNSSDLDNDNDGILDVVENAACTPSSPVCDIDNDGIPNNLDLDSDADGINDVRESNGTDVNGDGVVDGGIDANGVPLNANGGYNPPNTDGDGRTDPYDVDSDGDGIPDSIERGPNGNAPIDTDGDGTPDYRDLDSDNDGIPDATERGTGPTPVDTDGDGIPDYRDLDNDNDGILDVVENAACNPTSPVCDIDGDGIPNNLDLDSDGDGINDVRESNGLDVNGDGRVDGAVDADGVPVASNGGYTPPNTDSDANTDPYDVDSDADGIPDSVERGPNGNAPRDTDGDGTPDYRDLDSDNDGITDAIEKGPNGATPLDTDGDTIPDYRELDSDNDGIPDAVEKGTGATPVDTDGDGLPDYRDLDSDNDGIPDTIEKGPNGATPIDSDNDGIPDYRDLDSDDDGIPDTIEKGSNGATPLDTDNDGLPDYRDLDSDNDGIPDSIEKGADGNAPLDSDGDTIPDYRDLDSDNDGIPDSVEKGPNGNNPIDTDGDNIPDYLDLDSDNDGIPDSVEKGPNGATPIDTDNDGIPDYRDLDSDNDGITDAIEKGPNGATPLDTDNDGLPDYRDLDSDNDGIPDAVEKGTGSTPVDTDGDGLPDYRDLDSDNDGIPDSIERGPNGNAPIDTDGDGTPDYRDLDSDNDGIPDSVEKGPNGATPLDTDNDGTQDYRDLDSDNDGIPDAVEKGPNGATPLDTDNDGTPDYRDVDSDNDGITDAIEKGPNPNNPIDTDGDGLPDYRDLDSDNDGIPDAVEKGTGTTPVDTDGDGLPDYRDLDSDNDGIPDAVEKGPNGATPLDTDSDGIPDYRDLDSDNDGITDAIERGPDGNAPLDTDNDGTPDYRDLDSDNDGIPDATEKGTGPTLKDSDRDGIPDYRDANNTPIANDDSAVTEEDKPVTGNVLTNDSDIDGDLLKVTRFTINGSTYVAGTTVDITGVGTIVVNGDGSFEFKPAKDYNGTVPGINYTVADPLGNTQIASLIITVTPVNDAPVAKDDLGTVKEDGLLTGELLLNDTDVERNPLTVVEFVIGSTTYAVGQNTVIPGVGTIIIEANGKYTFIPLADFNGDVPTITYKISDGNGGTATAKLNITVTPVADPSDINVADVTICSGSSTTLKATGTLTGVTYRWYSDASLVNLVFVGDSYTTTALTSTTRFYVTVSNSTVAENQPGNGKLVTVTVAAIPSTATITATQTIFCSGDKAVFTSTASSGNQWYRNGVKIEGANQNTYTATIAGIYTVVVTNEFNCSSAPSNAITIVVNPLPQAPTLRADGDVKMCQDDIRIISTTIPSGYTIQWYLNDVLLPNSKMDTIHVTGPQRITAKLVSQSGCVSAKSNEITTEIVCQTGVLMPELFTPNDDGINDVIKPIPLGIKNFRCFKVYDRWGVLVFETTDKTKGWDGNYKGKRQATDSYIWIVEGVDYRGAVIKKTGVFTLVR